MRYKKIIIGNIWIWIYTIVFNTVFTNLNAFDNIMIFSRIQAKIQKGEFKNNTNSSPKQTLLYGQYTSNVKY